MKQTIILSLIVLIGSSVATAADTKSAAKTSTAEQEVITALNVRDPSSFIMSTGGATAKDSTIVPPAQAPTMGEAKVAMAAADKTGVRTGKRSVSLPIDEEQLLAVKPGDHVDIIAVFNALTSDKSVEKLAATMLQNVRVLGVVTTGNLRGKGVLTLELNPLETQYAILGARQADLGVAIRAPDDVELHPYEMAGFRHFFR